VVTEVYYKYLAPGAQDPDPYPITVDRVEEGQELPRHRVGDIIRLLDERLADPPEREFELVRVSDPLLVGFVPDISHQMIFVLVTDVESEPSQ
jgi:hypothetical protein